MTGQLCRLGVGGALRAVAVAGDEAEEAERRVVVGAELVPVHRRHAHEIALAHVCHRVADAIAWWRRANDGTPEVYTVYRAPYYRVRVGNYATRGEADRAARSVGGSFPGSFVVQDRVTVRQP